MLAIETKKHVPFNPQKRCPFIGSALQRSARFVSVRGSGDDAAQASETWDTGLESLHDDDGVLLWNDW